MFELRDDDMKNLRCQIGTSKLSVGNGRGGNRYTTFAFTEPGVAMLSSVLKSERAVQVNIAIIRAFIELRKRGETNRMEVSKIESFDDRLGELENKLTQVLDHIKTLTKLTSSPP